MALRVFAGKGPSGAPTWRPATLLMPLAALLLAACAGDQTPQEETGPRPGPTSKYDPAYDESVFGERGITFGTAGIGRAGGILGGGAEEGGALPVNKYLWQAALDTLSFLPLAATDPFSGVIATDWGSTPEAPGERYKVTAYILGPALSAASLKVAVFREVRDEKGLWLPAPVSAETARKLEDAILIRAREIRIAAREGGETG